MTEKRFIFFASSLVFWLLITGISAAGADQKERLFLAGDSGFLGVERPGLSTLTRENSLERAHVVVELILRGPTKGEQDRGILQVFPGGTKLERVGEEKPGAFVFYLEIPGLDNIRTRELQLMEDLLFRNVEQHIELESFLLMVRENKTDSFEPLIDHLPKPPSVGLASSPSTGRKKDKSGPSCPHTQMGGRFGALAGKMIVLAPGHGWYWDDDDTWKLQRPFVQSDIEDFSNVDFISQWVATYCYNAGAYVFGIRELDLNSNMVIADNNDPTTFSSYMETGTWSNTGLGGYEYGHAPFAKGDNPFSFGTSREATCVTGTPTASATWIPDIPENGWYNVYVSYGADTGRSPQAHYRIYHAGGMTDHYLDQRRWRFNWIFIGNYYFEEGLNPEMNKVVLLNDSSSAGHTVSADAVRFGGGMGITSRGTPGTSGEPRCDESECYNLQFCGAPWDVYASFTWDGYNGSIGGVKYGKYLVEESVAHGAPSMDAVMMSSHTNAFNTVARGLGTFVAVGFDNTWHDRFRNYVFNEIVNDCQKTYSDFVIHGTGIKYHTYTYNNPPYMDNAMPVFMGEWIFHDNARDMALYHDPQFRQYMGRAIYQGMVKYFANENSTDVHLLPEPPQNPLCVQTGATSVRLEWDPSETDTQGILGDPAESYRVYYGTHGRGLSYLKEVAGGTNTTADVGGLTPGSTCYFYLTAVNQGGESFPTEVLAVSMRRNPGDTPLLIVNGFDKLDRDTRVRDTWHSSTLYRQKFYKMNTFDYIVEHARAIGSYVKPVAFDSCSDEALELGRIDLSSYKGVIWIGGIQAERDTADPTNDAALSALQQALLEGYVREGGRLFISGSNIAWDLDRFGGDSFVDTVLRSGYQGDDAGIFSATGVSGSLFDSLGTISFDDGTGETYAVWEPDVISPPRNPGWHSSIPVPANRPRFNTRALDGWCIWHFPLKP